MPSVEVDTVKLARIALGNSVARAVIKRMLTPCPHGFENKLHHVLAILAGAAEPLGIECRIDYKLLEVLMKLGARIAKTDLEAVKDALKDPAVRRGIAMILESVARYGVTVPQKLVAPFLVVWNFTNMCNLRCKHCYQDAKAALASELSLKEKLRVVEMLDEAGVAAIAFSGGEPTVHPDFLAVASEAARRGIYVAVATNGIRLADKDFALKLKKAGVRYVEVSLDSVNPEEHDEFRGIPGAWEKAVQGIKNCVELGISTGIAMTVTRMNYREVEDMVKLAEELGVTRVIFFNFIPVGRGKGIAEWDLTPETREEVLRTIYRLARSSKVQVASTAPQFARVSVQLSSGCDVAPTHFAPLEGADPAIRSLAEFIGGCGAGRIYCAIQPEGTVTPCVFMPIPVGNLREKSFKEIWEESELLKKLRNKDLLKPHCGNCEYRYICGGCRARAYAYTGDPLGPDPGCVNNAQYWSSLLGESLASKVKVQEGVLGGPCNG